MTHLTSQLQHLHSILTYGMHTSVVGSDEYVAEVLQCDAIAAEHAGVLYCTCSSESCSHMSKEGVRHR